MGHKINPLIFRLGISNNWQYNLKEKKNWITSFFIYQLVSNQFFKYTTPHFNREYTRNNRLATGLINMEGEDQLVLNNFIKKSVLFSHLLVGSKNSILDINCYFYDYSLTNNKINLKSYFKLKNDLRKQIRNNNSRKRLRTIRYNQLYANGYLRRDKSRRGPAFFSKRIKRKRPSKYLKRWLRYFAPNFWVFNMSPVNSYRKNYRIFSLEWCKLTKIWIRLFSKLQLMTKKQKVFFINVFGCLLMHTVNLLKAVGLKRLVNRIYLLLLLINLMNFNSKMYNSLFFLDIFRKRYFIFKAVSKSIGNNLKELIPTVEKVNLKYLAIRERRMTSSLLTNLIITKLGQYFRINSILYPLSNWVKRHRNVLGYRIIISGRLTRRERASHMIKGGRSMPLSTIISRIDYNQDIKIMKFGMVGIKVYLYMKKKLRNSYYYFKFVV